MDFLALGATVTVSLVVSKVLGGLVFNYISETRQLRSDIVEGIHFTAFAVGEGLNQDLLISSATDLRKLASRAYGLAEYFGPILVCKKYKKIGESLTVMSSCVGITRKVGSHVDTKKEVEKLLKVKINI